MRRSRLVLATALAVVLAPLPAAAFDPIGAMQAQWNAWVDSFLTVVVRPSTAFWNQIYVALDPLEPVNRPMFDFNMSVKDDFIDPATEYLSDEVPPPVKEIATNFYFNLLEPQFMINHLIAGDQKAFRDTGWRFVINSTIGNGGIFDSATAHGFPRREIGFGEALCKRGLTGGPYLVLPLVGPTAAVDAVVAGTIMASGYYLLSLLSPWIAAADFVMNLTASASSLRYAGAMPSMDAEDPYMLQRGDFWLSRERDCIKSPAPEPRQPAVQSDSFSSLTYQSQ